MRGDRRKPPDPEPIDPEPIDPEPIDLEPVDLEPVDAEHARAEARFDRERPRDRRRVAIAAGALAVALVGWATVALTDHGAHRRATGPPTSVPAPDFTVNTRPAVDRITTLAPRLWAGLSRVTLGRFALIADDRLYVLDAARHEAQTTLVPVPEGHVQIDDQSGSSLLANTLLSTIVDTAPVRSRVLSIRDAALHAVAPARWWLLGRSGTIRGDRGGPAVHIPTGLQVTAAIRGGFVALDRAHARWVLWSGPAVTTLAPAAYELVATSASSVAFRHDCTPTSCPIVIDDPVHQATLAMTLPGVPRYAAFSPDGSRLAIVTTGGRLFVVDTVRGQAFGTPGTITSPSPAQPLTWTVDGRSLLVVQRDDVEVRRASDGALTSEITGTEGLEQIVALP